MPIRAYQEMSLNRAQSVLGDAFHYAVNVCGIPGTDFVKLFIGSFVSKRIENGEPAYVIPIFEKIKGAHCKMNLQ